MPGIPHLSIQALLLATCIALPCSASPPAGAPAAESVHWQRPTDVDARKCWSYAAVHFTQADDLAKGLRAATWDPATKTWHATVPGKGTLVLTPTQQSMTEGDALFSARIWQADRDYACVIVETTLHATVTAGARIVCIKGAEPPVQHQVAGLFAQESAIKDGGGTCILPINAIVHNVHKGDRICFLLTNSGDGKGSNVLQTWDVQVLGLPPLVPGKHS